MINFWKRKKRGRVTSQEERQAIESEFREGLSNTTFLFGVVEQGTAAPVEITNSSKHKIQCYAASCGCVGDLAVKAKGKKFSGNVQISNGTPLMCWTDGENYYFSEKRGDFVQYKDLRTGDMLVLPEDKIEALTSIKLQHWRQTVTLYTHENTPMYTINENRKFIQYGFKPKVFVSLEAYILPQA